MKGNSNPREIHLTKNFAQKAVSMICVFLSFFLLNFYFVSLVGFSFFDRSSWVTNQFFTLSWILLLIGIIYSFRGIFRTISFCILYVLFVVVAHLESISFLAKGEFFHLFDGFSVPYSQWSFYTGENFILFLFLSLFFVILACYFFHHGHVLPSTGYSKAFFYLGIFCSFLLCRGIAYYSLGPQIIYTSGKESNDFKTIYLNYQKETENFKISGLYDFTLRGCYYQVIQQWEETDRYLRKGE